MNNWNYSIILNVYRLNYEGRLRNERLWRKNASKEQWTTGNELRRIVTIILYIIAYFRNPITQREHFYENMKCIYAYYNGEKKYKSVTYVIWKSKTTWNIVRVYFTKLARYFRHGSMKFSISSPWQTLFMFSFIHIYIHEHYSRAYGTKRFHLVFFLEIVQKIVFKV